ncbi:MAG: RIP metalloprotease RseP [Verrucomicrobia bacterium]|nr:RIP metalloprotease RseP [Verrucomicrobiota bacterium]
MIAALSGPWGDGVAIAGTVVVALILFGLTVAAHEFGHFWAARKMGLVVERFAIGFGPKIYGKVIDGVEWQINLLPLGGFVQLPQMNPAEGLEGKAAEGHKDLPPASPGAKIFTALAGPLASLALGVACAAGVWVFGVPTNMTYRTTTIGWVEAKSPAAKAGILPGDKILAIDGQRPERWAGRPGAVVESILLGIGREIVLELDREGREIVTVRVVPEPDKELEGLRRLGFEMYPAQPAWVDKVIEGGPAARAGIRPGEKLVSLNGRKIWNPAAVKAAVESGAEQMEFGVEDAKGHVRSLSLRPEQAINRKDRMIGVVWKPSDMQITHPTPQEQVGSAAGLVFRTLRALVSPASHVGVQHLSGPLGIFERLVSLLQTDPRLVLYFSVILNVNLAVLNLLPIPVLDGGHILFSLVEAIRRRQLRAKTVERIQTAFVILLAGFFLLVTYHDSLRLKRRMDKSAEATEMPVFRPATEKK